MLKASDNKGKIVSQNTYWLQAKHDYTSLNSMSKASIEAKMVNSFAANDYHHYTIRFTNISKQLAFFINPQLKLNNEEIAPCLWSDNYFSLSPGESTTVEVSCPDEKLNGLNAALVVEGWNIDKQETPVNNDSL